MELRSGKGEAARAEKAGPKRQAPSALPSAPFFLASARFIEKKNLSRLIQAYARYRTLCGGHRTTDNVTTDGRKAEDKSQKSVVSGLVVPWSLVLLGDGELRPALTALRSALGLDASVHLPGFKQYAELPAYYGLAGAFIHASTTEQWGLVVNEAMASGLPVLVSNRSGCATDLVQEGVNGFTFDPYDVEQIAQLMLKISLARGGEATPPGSFSAFQDVSLSAFGAASARIISNWGPERFTAGLKAAVKCALEVGAKSASMLDCLLLAAMMKR